MNRLLLLLALALPVVAAPRGQLPSAQAEGKPVALQDLFARFAQSKGFSASFVEEKKIAFLKVPLVNKGRLYFAAPARFARHVDEPERSSLYISGDQLLVVDGSGKKRIDLAAAPAVKQLLSSVLNLLSGNRGAIEAAYGMEFQTEGAGWHLTLTPKSQDLRGILSKLEFSGSGYALSSMTLHEASGDTSTMRFHDVRHGRKFTDAELEKHLTPPAD